MTHQFMSFTRRATLLLALTFAGTASANAAVNSIIGYLNLVDPAVVAEIRAAQGDDATDQSVALAILDRLLSDGIVDPEVREAMVAAVLVDDLHASTFDVFLLDVVTGTRPLLEVLRDPDIDVLVQSDGDGLSVAGVLEDAKAGANDRTDTRPLCQKIREGTQRTIPDLQLIGLDGCQTANENDVTESIQTNLENPDAVEDIRTRYEDAISPRTPDEA